MTIKPTFLCVTIVQGATLDEAWARSDYPYLVVEECGILVKKSTGEPAPDSDRVPEDYTGCTAEVGLIHPITGAVILTLSTANGGIVLDDDKLRLYMDYVDTAALVYGDTAPAWKRCTGQVEVTRPDGTRERQYTIDFSLDPETTT